MLLPCPCPDDLHLHLSVKTCDLHLLVVSPRAELFRSSTSVPANIAEGVGKRSKAERRNYDDHTLGSAFESGSHLDIVRLLKCVPDEDINNGKAMWIEIVKMLMRT